MSKGTDGNGEGHNVTNDNVSSPTNGERHNISAYNYVVPHLAGPPHEGF